MQGLQAISDLFALNLCFLLCCIPVFTAGASAAALYGVLLRDEESGVVRSFFRKFRENFRQATAAWLILMALGVVLHLDFVLLSRMDYPLVELVLYAAAFLLVGVSCYVFPQIAYYKNSLLRIFKNSLLMSVSMLGRTLLMILVAGLPVWVLLLDVQLFGQMLMLWLLIGFAVSAKCNARILKGIFEKLPKE